MAVQYWIKKSDELYVGVLNCGGTALTQEGYDSVMESVNDFAREQAVLGRSVTYPDISLISELMDSVSKGRAVIIDIIELFNNDVPITGETVIKVHSKDGESETQLNTFHEYLTSSIRFQINMERSIRKVNSNNSSPPNTPPRKYRAVICPGAPNRNRVPVPNEQ